jgi:hypothetical protein
MLAFAGISISCSLLLTPAFLDDSNCNQTRLCCLAHRLFVARCCCSRYDGEARVLRYCVLLIAAREHLHHTSRVAGSFNWLLISSLQHPITPPTHWWCCRLQLLANYQFAAT